MAHNVSRLYIYMHEAACITTILYFYCNLV